MTRSNTPKALAFFGFGEAANAFLDGWGASRPAHVSAFDVKTDQDVIQGDMRARYDAKNVAGAATPASALEHAEVVFSTVTADQALAAATAAAPHLRPETLWFDCNSCAPGSK